MGLPGCWAASWLCSWFQVATGLPATAMISSLGLSPASWAGDLPRFLPAQGFALFSAVLLAGTQVAI